MSKDSELIRQAYMDGELSVDEVIGFESSMDTSARQELEADKEFEQALVARLNTGGECPDELWQDIKGRLKPARRSPQRILHWAAAACLTLVVGIVVLAATKGSRGTLTVSFPQDISDFGTDVSVPGDWDKVRSSLTANGFHVNLTNPDPDNYHNVELLGVKYHRLGGKKVAQVYFSCCGRPVSAFLMDTNGVTDGQTIEDYIEVENTAPRLFRATNSIDRYRIMVMSPHGTGDVLDLFS